MTPSNHKKNVLVARSKLASLVTLTTGLSAALLMTAAGCDTLTQTRSNVTGEFGAPAGQFAPMADGGAGAAVAREIEEADIVKLVGDKLYALNRLKGLIIIGVADPDAPTILGQLDLKGRGVEMYVVGQQVFALLSADYYFPYIEGTPLPADVAVASNAAPAPDFEGSRLAVIDVSNPAAPTLQGKINLVGFANASRRVGQVIYVIGRNEIPYAYDAVQGDAHIDQGFVASINVADPANIIPVQRETFAGEGLEMHAEESLLLVASRIFDFNSSQTYTRVQAVDISDPAGAITIRGSVDVPGFIRNRFYMDVFESVLRIATESGGFGFQQVRLYTYDLTDLDAITPLGQVPIIQNESLEAVRFDGPRGYLVTFLRVDPLFVVDLRDPANPVVTGELEVPGFSTHIEPRGERLIAVGVDDTNGRRPAVAYYDVSDPANPSQLARVILGPPGSFTESEALYDEKAFKIIDELGLIAIPFQHYDGSAGGGSSPPGVLRQDIAAGTPYVAPQCVSAVQLVDYNDAALTQRGWFDHAGSVQRVGLIGQRVYSLSHTGFKTVDITDRDAPAALGAVEFFTADEMSRMAIYDCGASFGIPVDPGFGGGFNLLALLMSGMCGATGAVPLFIIPVLAISAARRRHRRR